MGFLELVFLKEAFSCFSDGCLNDDEETMIGLLEIAN